MKKFLLAAVSAAFLAACSAPEGTFNLSIDIPEAGNSPVRISLEDNQILFEGELKWRKSRCKRRRYPTTTRDGANRATRCTGNVLP